MPAWLLQFQRMRSTPEGCRHSLMQVGRAEPVPTEPGLTTSSESPVVETHMLVVSTCCGPARPLLHLLPGGIPCPPPVHRRSAIHCCAPVCLVVGYPYQAVVRWIAERHHSTAPSSLPSPCDGTPPPGVSAAPWPADVADLLIDAVPDAELPAAAGSAFGGSPPARSQPSTPQSARQEPEIRYPTIPPAAPHSQVSFGVQLSM